MDSEESYDSDDFTPQQDDFDELLEIHQRRMVYLGFLSDGTRVAFPSSFLRAGYYILEDGFPYVPDYCCGTPVGFRFVTEGEEFFLDEGHTIRFDIAHLQREIEF
jgi:hypothetical protein